MPMEHGTKLNVRQEHTQATKKRTDEKNNNNEKTIERVVGKTGTGYVGLLFCGALYTQWSLSYVL